MSHNLTFSPAEAASLSGVSADLQRDWRRRSLIPASVGGRARFALDEVAGLYVMNACSALAPIAAAVPLSRTLAPDLAAYALGDGDEPTGVAAVMKGGGFETFPSMEAAIAALEAEGAEVLRLLPFDLIATPFKIRVRKALEDRGASE